MRQKQVRNRSELLSETRQATVRFASEICVNLPVMREAPLDLENLRRALELSVERAEAYALHLAQARAPRHLVVEAQDEWSDAASNLAAYLLATGGAGWIGATRPPAYGSATAGELRPM